MLGSTLRTRRKLARSMRYLDLLIWSCLLLRWTRGLWRRVFKGKIWSILVQISYCRYHDLQEVEEAVVDVAVEEEGVMEEEVAEVAVVQEVEAVAEVLEGVVQEVEVLVDEAQEEVLEEEEADVEEVASKSSTRIVSCKRDAACLFSKLFYIEIRLSLHHFIPLSSVNTSFWTKAHQISMGSTLYYLTIGNDNNSIGKPSRCPSVGCQENSSSSAT
mmetsp:Transcript_8786/g.14924  ORF Transcript_8786/g.14924 Transcript_8786/m.14924 type:complete len:216 (+) Transcript_8786:291-938(+)